VIKLLIYLEKQLDFIKFAKMEKNL